MQKYNDRKKGLSELLNDPSETTIAKRKWAMMAEINATLHHEGQSSEESDYDCDRRPRQAVPLKVKKPYFRRRIVGELMEDVDVAIDKLHESTTRAAGKRYTPRVARIRIRSEVKSERTVKHGLPKALYHRRYLQRLNPNALAQVKPTEDQIPHLAQFVDGVESDTSMDE